MSSHCQLHAVGEPTALRRHGHTGAVVAVQADETKVVSAATDGSVRVWCLRTGRELYAIEGLSRKLSSLHFNRHLLVCDGNDESIVVYDFSDPRGSRIVDENEFGS